MQTSYRVNTTKKHIMYSNQGDCVASQSFTAIARKRISLRRHGFVNTFLALIDAPQDGTGRYLTTDSGFFLHPPVINTQRIAKHMKISHSKRKEDLQRADQIKFVRQSQSDID